MNKKWETHKGKIALDHHYYNFSIKMRKNSNVLKEISNMVCHVAKALHSGSRVVFQCCPKFGRVKKSATLGIKLESPAQCSWHLNSDGSISAPWSNDYPASSQSSSQAVNQNQLHSVHEG